MNLKAAGEKGRRLISLYFFFKQRRNVNRRLRIEGDDTAYGQAIFPVPAADPNDPLQWGRWKKLSILVACSFYSFLSNSALLGPSVYVEIYAEDFGVTPNDAAGLVNYPNLAFGFGKSRGAYFCPCPG